MNLQLSMRMLPLGGGCKLGLAHMLAPAPDDLLLTIVSRLPGWQVLELLPVAGHGWELLSIKGQALEVTCGRSLAAMHAAVRCWSGM